MNAEKILSKQGKQRLFESIENYVEMKIENRITPANKETIEKLKKTETILANMINSLKIVIE